MKALLFFLSRSRAVVISAIVAGVISGGTSVGVIALIHQAMDREGATLPMLAAAFAGLCVVQVVSQIVSEVLLLRLVEDTILDMRMRMSTRILRTPLRKLEEISPHRLLAAVAGDARSVADAVSLSPLIFMNGAILLGCLVYMATLSWVVFLGVFGFMFVVTALYQLATRRGGVYLARARESADEVYSALRGLTEGTKELKIHNERQKAFLDDLLEEPSREYRDANIRGMATFRIAGAMGRIMFLVLIGLLLFLVPTLLDVGQHLINGYILVILYMLMPMTGLLNSLPTLASAGVSLHKIERLGLSLAGGDDDGDGQLALPPADAAALPATGWSSLRLDGATHAYESDTGTETFTLGPIDLDLQPGELVFVIGGNGSGKTTLAKLLVGLYTPEEGRIELDGETVEADDLDAYRRLFTMVFTDFYLFDQFLGLDRDDLDSRAQHYLEKLRLGHKVEIEEGRLSTTDLSQGQRKRLALLTAYLEDRPIYVFDEWAADQDPVFKKVFYYELLPELRGRGKTVVVISHDDHYYDVADRIVKLDFGQIEYDSARSEVPDSVQDAGFETPRRELT